LIYRTGFLGTGTEMLHVPAVGGVIENLFTWFTGRRSKETSMSEWTSDRQQEIQNTFVRIL